ncbi:MAG: hypothetical protein ABI651_15375 [Verrucomicrobiota bacterium]
MPLNELENHLREDIEQQVRSGLSAQQAFEVAVQRIGQARALETEFKKVGGKTERNQMKRVAILAALFGMLMGISMILPALGKHYKHQGAWTSDEMRGLQLGIVLVIVGAGAAFSGIKRQRPTRGRNLISIFLVAVGGYFLFWEILVLSSFISLGQTGRVFGAELLSVAAAAVLTVLFFGSCLYFNRHLPSQAAHES